jgi:uncharacterized protein
MRRLSPKALVIIAALLTVLLVAYVFAGGISGSGQKAPRDRRSDRQAGVQPRADAQPPADPWATLPGSEGGEIDTADASSYTDQGDEMAPPPPPPPPRPAPVARPAPVTQPAARSAAPPATRPTPAPRTAPQRTVEAPPPPQRVAARPSFNCRNARTRGEIAICRNGGLANLDRQMAGRFNRAMSGASAAQRQQLVRTRTSFLRRREACGSEACIAGAYRARISEIGRIADSSPRPARVAAPASTPPKAAAAAPAATVRPSFNCRFARTRSEVLICSEPGLANLDRQMAAQFSTAARQATPGQRDVLERSRMRFLYRRERCGTPACIAAAYRARMTEIDDIAARHWREP